MGALLGRQVLRDFQEKALNNLRRALAKAGGNKRRPLLVSPTGSGKTTIAAALIGSAVALGKTVLFLAHRKELIDQCSARLDGAGVAHGVIMSGHPRALPWLPVQIASIPTLVSRLERGGSMPGADIIIVDEAHHARASTYARILEAYPNAVIVGLTATPWRNDGRGLGELFDDIIVAAQVRELIDRGFLVDCDGYTYDSPEVKKKVKKKGADYDQHGLELVMSSNKIVGNVVACYKKHAAGKRGVVFAVNVKHSLHLVERFRAEGVNAEHVDGEMPDTERAAILEKLSRNEIQVVCNVNVLSEGWDCPQLEVCMLVRPTLSLVLYMQQVGRVLRPACLDCGVYAHPSAHVCTACKSTNIKKVARIHDHAGCIDEHGLPDMIRDYSLDSDRECAGSNGALPSLTTCKACRAKFLAMLGPDCPACGHVNKPAVGSGIPGEIDNASVREIPIRDLPRFKDAFMDAKKEHYKRLLATAKANGWRRGAAAQKFNGIYREWPGEWRYEMEKESERS